MLEADPIENASPAVNRITIVIILIDALAYPRNHFDLDSDIGSVICLYTDLNKIKVVPH